MDVAGRGLCQAARSGHRLVSGRHLGRVVDVEVALFDQPLDELIEQLRQLCLAFLVVAAAERLEHLGRELPALHQRVENRLLEGVERPVAFVLAVEPVVRLIVAAGEPRLQEKIGELVEQRLQVDRVGELGAEFRVGVEAHRWSLLPEEYSMGGGTGYWTGSLVTGGRRRRLQLGCRRFARRDGQLQLPATSSQ